MKKLFYSAVILLFLFTIFSAVAFTKGNDFYTLEFQPGLGDSKVILVGISSNERYFAYIEVYSPMQSFSQNYKVFARFYIKDVSGNAFAAEPIQVAADVYNKPLDQDCFSFFEYDLLSALMKKAQSQINAYDIAAGVLPVKVLPFKAGGIDVSKVQSFHLFNGEMGELAEVELKILKHPSLNILDVRLHSRGTEEIVKVLKEDKKVPRWRSFAKDYKINRVYFYGNHKKYIIAFIEVLLEPEKGWKEKRLLSVTGEITKIWENAFK